MRKPLLIWGSAAVALAGLGLLLAQVELDTTGMLASVLGLLIAGAGLAVSVYKVIISGGGSSVPSRSAEPGKPNVSASGTRSVAVGGDNSGIISTGDGPVQNITASAQGAAAYGAQFGNVIHYHGIPPVPGSPIPPESRTDLDEGEK